MKKGRGSQQWETQQRVALCADVRNPDISGASHKEGRLLGAVQLSLVYFTLQLSPLDPVYQLQEKKCKSIYVYRQVVKKFISPQNNIFIEHNNILC